MSMNQIIDPKAKKILMQYDPNFPEQTSKENFEYAKAKGLMFDTEELTHDQINSWAFLEFKRCNKESVVNSFLYGLGHNIACCRSAISAYAIMTHFPPHDYLYKDEFIFCAICTIYPKQKVDYSFLNACRFTGSLVSGKPDELAFYLQQHNEEPILNNTPTESDIHTFVAILHIIDNCDDNTTPTIFRKLLRKLSPIKFSVEEVNALIDTLGYCGILQTTEHQGFIYHFPGYLTPRKTRSSDWAYPVDFWTRKNGINTDALNYWFSHYPIIANWKSKNV
ncbi:hypothetical protein [Xylocopilactobacillus apicola]|uniref:Uncharacterized protein n=1 Tax=Xylocopilactobacillus apicola TaxID=2932184 RepID=A0AAU9CUJ0_9LACO|nr:hypothetical protein [Xylocopilactobacillus apicola]BDR57667.1 hypothetical protein XA3_01080 [Xylocopilactobacillus apicola]